MKPMNKKGFTLAELLIVVAIIAVLAAVSIPVFTTQLHKARVAADWANVHAYFSQLQYDYQETGKINDSYLRYLGEPPLTSFELFGMNVELKTGYLYIQPDGDNGYNFLYSCKQYHPYCELVLPVN